jgi:CMP-N,N'-diacetyllegionaminic acid synthase
MFVPNRRLRRAAWKAAHKPVSVLALIPARSGSKGIPGKNWRKIGGKTLVRLALDCARNAGCEWAILSTDTALDEQALLRLGPSRLRYVHRPAELAQDDTPMLAVVQHALEQIPGPDDQIIVLLQPTQPLRTVAHVQTAIARLRETQADSVVSVVEVPKTSHALWQCEINPKTGRIDPWPEKGDVEGYWFYRPARRQDLSQTYRCDGTVYATTRESIARCESLFGSTVVPLIIPASESCELDTLADWDALEARVGRT